MNEIAPEGYVWICLACGKRSKDNYGENPIDKGWDESCVLNSQMAAESDITLVDGKITRVDGPLYETIEELKGDSK